MPTICVSASHWWMTGLWTCATLPSLLVETAASPLRCPRQPLAMPGHFPSVGLDRTLSDGDGVADLGAAVGGPLAERSPYRTMTAQTVKHAGVECLPRRHIHITVDGLVRDPHARGTGMLPPQPLGDLLWRPIVIKFGGQARGKVPGEYRCDTVNTTASCIR